jgi:hypothetical protein
VQTALALLFEKQMNLRKIIIWSGATVAVTLLLGLLLFAHPTNRGRKSTNWKLTSTSKKDDAGLTVVQNLRDAGGVDHNRRANHELNVASAARARTVARASNASDPVYDKARRAGAGSEQPGGSTFPSAPSSEPSAPSNEMPLVQGPPLQIHLPAPFLPLPDTRTWSSDDAAGVARLAQEFNDSLVSSGQSPADPAYLHAWMTAEWLANERYRSYFGIEAFNALRNTGN